MNSVDKSAKQPRFIVTFNRNITLLTLIALPILISLGIWQWSRAAEKRELENRYAHLQAQPPVTLTAASLNELPDYQRVTVQGHFDNEHTWLLDNKQRQGRVGYEVVTPFVLNDGQRLLVNRGWLAAGKTRAQLPVIDQVKGEVTLFAELVSVVKHPLLDARTTRQDWPRVVMAIDITDMSQQLNQELLHRYLRLDESSTGALITDWQAVNMSPEKHMGYAFQWFGLAAALVIWFVFANTNLFEYWRSRRQKTKQ